MGSHRYGKGTTEVLSVKGTKRFRVVVGGQPVGMVAPTTEPDGIDQGWTWSSYNLHDNPTGFGMAWSGFRGSKAAAAKHVVKMARHTGPMTGRPSHARRG